MGGLSHGVINFHIILRDPICEISAHSFKLFLFLVYGTVGSSVLLLRNPMSRWFNIYLIIEF